MSGREGREGTGWHSNWDEGRDGEQGKCTIYTYLQCGGKVTGVVGW